MLGGLFYAQRTPLYQSNAQVFVVKRSSDLPLALNMPMPYFFDDYLATHMTIIKSPVIAKMTMGVQLVDGRTGNADLDWLHRTVARLAQQAQLPMPEVGFYESPEVNAFATGPSRSRSPRRSWRGR